jgi:hypothetical protein
MFNKQRTTISNKFLSMVGYLSMGVIMSCLGCSYKLLKDLCSDTVNPVDVCQKINHLKVPEYIAHFLLSGILTLLGSWGIGILNVPFIFYHFAQCCEGKHLLDHRKVFSTLKQEMRIIKTKASFFFIIMMYYLWEWATWCPPDYLPMGHGFNVMKNIQVSH